MPEQFLYLFTPGDRPELGESLDPWTDDDFAVMDRHVAHLKRGTDAGIVILAGRSQDWVGPAIVVLETTDEAAAREYMEADPFVSSGMFGAALHPFRVAMGRSVTDPDGR